MKLLHAAALTYKCKLDFRPVIQVLANADIFFSNATTENYKIEAKFSKHCILWG